MPSNYLQSSDYSAFGIANNSNTAQLVTQASQLIDGYLKRTEGLIYVPDVNGTPIYMQSLLPSSVASSQTLTITENISPSNNPSAPMVNVTVTGPVTTIQKGAVGIIDIGNDIVEPVIVTSITGNIATLFSINYSHLSGATIQFGLLIDEQIDMYNSRPITKLAKCPIANVIGGLGRYSYTRKNDSTQRLVDDTNLLAIYTQFGGPPSWEPWTPTTDMWDIYTGEFWAPAGVMLAYFTQIRVQYVAGFTYLTLPANIKQACANIINNTLQMPINAGIKSITAGGTNMTRFSNTLIDANTKDLLDPYAARLFV